MFNKHISLEQSYFWFKKLHVLKYTIIYILNFLCPKVNEKIKEILQ